MNSSTRLRLAKEARALLPFWAAMAGLMVVPFLLRSDSPLNFAFSIYIFGCVLLGSVVFGLEFQHRTMGLLLSQPVSRRRLWWEKMLVLGAALLCLLLWLIVLGIIEANSAHVQDGFVNVIRLGEVEQLRAEFFKWPDALIGIAILLLPLFLGFCTGPVLTLLARGTIGGLALAFLCPWAIGITGFLLMNLMWGNDNLSENDSIAVILIFFAVPCLYMGGLVLLGCRRFQNLEDIHGHRQELSLPAALTRPFAGFTERLTLNHGGVLGQLVRKEVRLHLPAFVVAGMFVGLWLLLLAVVSARLSVSKEFLLLPAVWLGLGIPVVAGIVSTAEERGLGLLDWHLTLPVSARRQWFIKVLVALAVNVVLGLLLPGLLGYAASWLVGGNFDTNLNAKDSQAFLIANAVIFCAALYASTAAVNSMRALVGAIAIFVLGGIGMSIADYGAHRLCDYFGYSPSFLWGSGWPSSRTSYLLHFYVWPLFWLLIGSSFCVGGFAHFRRTLGSIRQPIAQMTILFIGALLYLLIAFSCELLTSYVYPHSYIR